MRRRSFTRPQLALGGAAAVAAIIFFHPILEGLIWIRNLGLFLASLSRD